MRVYVTAAPTDGQANDAVIESLAKRLGVPKSSLFVARGGTSRTKQIDLGSLARSEAIQRLSQNR